MFTMGVGVSTFYLAEEMRTERAKKRDVFQFPSRKYTDPKYILTDPLKYWNSLPSEDRTVGTILGINTMVFLGWRFYPEAMVPHFLHMNMSGKVYTLITSTFSHNNGPHFLFNMVALWSFGRHIHHYLGQEYFTAFYLTSGAFSALCSHLFYGLTRQPVASLGASGALFGLVGLVYGLFPNAQINLFFVLPFAAKTIIPGVATFDLIGLFGAWLRWFRLDHAAHLGGLLLGVLFSTTYFHPQKHFMIRNYASQKKKQLNTFLNNINQKSH
uniref:Peptidase S54 rhomboid domain-containing protein n=1 Tax=Arcella intermedia TaxID=1963864 RepID=A0A6B2LDP4_9EUKA